MDCTTGVIILAGGKSERMHFPKAYLSYNGKTFLKNIVDEYLSAGIKNILVVLNKNFCSDKWDKYLNEIRANVTIVENQYPDLGRLYSIKLGLKNLMDTNYCFIQNVDNPFISKQLINNLLISKNPEGYTSPVYKEKGGHPVLISKSVMRLINKYPHTNFKLKDILNHFTQFKVTADKNILININTPNEYEMYTLQNAI